MTLLLVVLLAALWGAVFLPAILRARQEASPITSVGSFRRGMRALSTGRLAGPGGRWVLMPQKPEDLDSARRRTLMRRRRVFVTLIALSVGTGLVSVIPAGRDLLKMHLFLDVLLAGYVLYLVQMKQSDETMPETEDEELEPEPAYLQAEHF